MHIQRLLILNHLWHCSHVVFDHFRKPQMWFVSSKTLGAETGRGNDLGLRNDWVFWKPSDSFSGSLTVLMVAYPQVWTMTYLHIKMFTYMCVQIHVHVSVFSYIGKRICFKYILSVCYLLKRACFNKSQKVIIRRINICIFKPVFRNYIFFLKLILAYLSY